MSEWLEQSRSPRYEVTVDPNSPPGTWGSAVADNHAAARELINTFLNQARGEAKRSFLGPLLLAAVKMGTYFLHYFWGEKYKKDVKELAARIGLPPRDVLFANIAYDLSNTTGCSTFVASMPHATLHARNLDWEFPKSLLRKYVTILRVSNSRCGPYSVVTWPGLFGVLTAVAAERFAITVNYVRHKKKSTVGSVTIRAVTGAWPVTWLLRKVFDEEPNYASALKRLRRSRLVAPVIFVISGPNPLEGAVIEHDGQRGVVRPLTNKAVVATNHYVSTAFASSDAGNNMLNSDDRFAFLAQEVAKSTPQGVREALDLLSRKPLFQDGDTQYQVAMSARGGVLTVVVPTGAPATAG